MIIDGKKIADEIKQSLKKKTDLLISKGIRPGLGIVLVGNDPSSVLYVNLKERVAREIGFHFEKKYLPDNASKEAVIAAIQELNVNKNIHGQIIQIPLPAHLSLDDVIQVIDYKKDIDCCHPINLSNLFLGHTSMVPPTAEAVVRLIRSVQKNISGMNTVVIGDGFFGRQIAVHMLNADATVTVTHGKTKELASLTSKADCIVTVLGKPHFITAPMIKRGAIVIDVGITTRKKNVLGDVDFAGVQKKASAITPVPGGVGPMTVALLMENVLRAAEQSLTQDKKNV